MPTPTPIYAPIKTTRKPTGMTASRDGLKFTFGWKILDENHGDGQWFSYQTNLDAKTKKWNSVPVTTADTSATVSLTASNYYPTTNKQLEYVTGIVMGKRSQSQTTDPISHQTTIQNYKASEWAAYKFPVLLPRPPELTEEVDTDDYPKCTFTWSVETSDTDYRPFHSIEWQTMRLKDSNVKDGSKLRWGSYDSNAYWTSSSYNEDYVTADLATNSTGSVTITEDSTSLAQGSYTRWIRFRSRGARGASEWRYIRHVYAKPWAAVIDSNQKRTYADQGAGATTKVRVEWTASWTSAHPIDRVLVKWCIAVPRSNQRLPEEPTWNTALSVLDSRNTDVAEFTIDQLVGEDKCLWVRVDTVHDVHTTPSGAVLVRSGKLATPGIGQSITLNPSTNTADVTVTHNSSVPDSKIALYFHRDNDKPYIVHVFDRSGGNEETATVRLNYVTSTTRSAFSVMEFQGDAKRNTHTYTISNTTYTYYRWTIDPNMQSDLAWKVGEVPLPPSGVTAKSMLDTTRSGSTGETIDTADVLVDWLWNWADATHAEVSWSDFPEAWESTSPPEAFLVDRVYASQIYVHGLSVGKRWYFRVRFLAQSGDATIYSPYSSRVSVKLATPPAPPATESPSPATVTEPDAMAGASSTLVKEGQSIYLNWVYSNEDGSKQKFAEIREVSVTWSSVLNENVITEIAMRGKVDGGAHRWKFSPSDFTDSPWTAGTTHYLQVRVTSKAGLQSDWSNPVAISVARSISCSIAGYGSEMQTITVDSKPRLVLTALPLTVTVSGAEDGDISKVIIERKYDYNVVRPNEYDFHGVAGETIVQMAHRGSGAFEIGLDDLVGTLDDFAWYTVIASVEDDFGQVKTAKQSFQVRWDHQPVKPGATVSIVDGEAIITPTVPDGTTVETGDVFDIYRLSADRPELIVSGGTFGQTYRDPYPAFGDLGGHRVVYRSLYGDVFTAGSKAAWTDLGEADGDHLESRQAVIDFDRYSVAVDLNLDLNSQWTKDFHETTYLGGSIQGDWNPAIQRKSTVNTVTIPMFDEEQLRNLRRLATHPGICHIRTPDGSSYACDIQVVETRSHRRGGVVAEFTLTITRVDTEALDGVEVT